MKLVILTIISLLTYNAYAACDYSDVTSSQSDPWVIYSLRSSLDHKPHFDYNDKILIEFKQHNHVTGKDEFSILVNNDPSGIWANVMAEGSCHKGRLRDYYMIKVTGLIVDGCNHTFHVYTYEDDSYGYSSIVFGDHSSSSNQCHTHGHNDNAVAKGAFATRASAIDKNP